MNFGQKIRDYQAKFRDTSNTVSSLGKNPKDLKGIRNRHLLALGSEMDNLFPELRKEESVLKFFADRDIKWWKSARSGDDCKRVGPTRNMASSQIFCVNFLYPIKEDRELLMGILKKIDPSIIEVGTIHSYSADLRSKLSSFVEFEWVGTSNTLEKRTYSRGAKATSIDAFIVGLSEDARIGFFFEWKIVEEYRSKNLGDGPSGQTRRSTYTSYLQHPNCLLSKANPFDAVLFEPFYQLVRMGLLGQKMIYEDHELDKVYIIPVFPRENRAYNERITSLSLRRQYPQLKTVSEIASTFFLEPVTFKPLFTNELWGTVQQVPRKACHKNWLEYMKTRYFDSL